MTDAGPWSHISSDGEAPGLDLGGLRFAASFRGAGATLRIYGPVEGRQTELLRLDDFVDDPHYHVPSDGPPIAFDRARLGDPLDWYIAQLRDHLGEMLAAAGFGDLLAAVDFRAVADNVDKIRKIVVDCVPAGFTRAPG